MSLNIYSVLLQSYTKKRAHANFRTTILRREQKQSTLCLHLLVKEVANTHPKRICDLMQAADGDVPPTVYPVVHRLPTDVNQIGQISVTHVFFIITLRRFNCDSYCCFFIVVLFYYTNKGRFFCYNERTAPMLYTLSVDMLFLCILYDAGGSDAAGYQNLSEGIAAHVGRLPSVHHRHVVVADGFQDGVGTYIEPQFSQ